MAQLRRVREWAGLTQAQVAEKLGTTQSAISRLEADEQGGITWKRYCDYMDACGVIPLNLELVDPAEAQARAEPQPYILPVTQVYRTTIAEPYAGTIEQPMIPTTAAMGRLPPLAA